MSTAVVTLILGIVSPALAVGTTYFSAKLAGRDDLRPSATDAVAGLTALITRSGHKRRRDG